MVEDGIHIMDGETNPKGKQMINIIDFTNNQIIYTQPPRMEGFDFPYWKKDLITNETWVSLDKKTWTKI